MGDYLLRIGKNRWPIIGRFPLPPFMSDGARTWRELLEFRQFRLYLEYSEKDNPRMFVGKTMQGMRDPGNVTAIDPPNQVVYTNAGALKVRMQLQQIADHPLSADEIALLGPIFNSIEEVSNTVRRKRIKDIRQRWGEEQRRMYDSKIHDLIMGGLSDRQVADAIPPWANEHPELRRYKVPSDSCLQKWAAVERKKNQDMKRKRTK